MQFLSRYICNVCYDCYLAGIIIEEMFWMPEDRNLEKTIVETRILLKKPHPSARKQREDVYMHPCEKTSIVHALA